MTLIGGLAQSERVQLAEERRNDDHNGTELDDHEERVVERARHVELDELIEQHHVARRGYGQPFGNALDDAEQDGLQRFEQDHGLILPIPW